MMAKYEVKTVASATEKNVITGGYESAMNALMNASAFNAYDCVVQMHKDSFWAEYQKGWELYGISDSMFDLKYTEPLPGDPLVLCVQEDQGDFLDSFDNEQEVIPPEILLEETIEFLTEEGFSSEEAKELTFELFRSFNDLRDSKANKALEHAVHRELADAYWRSQEPLGYMYSVSSSFDAEYNAQFSLCKEVYAEFERGYVFEKEEHVSYELVCEIANLLLANKPAEARALAEEIFPPYKGE